MDAPSGRTAALEDGLKPARAGQRMPRTFWTRRKLVVAVVAVMLLLALALGLGLGLGLKRSPQPGSDSGGGSGGGGGGGGPGTGGPASLWQPSANTSWQIVLSKTLKVDASTTRLTPDVDVYDIDLFDNTSKGTSTATIDALHRLGKKVVCYFSAGSFEPNRPDSDQFTAADQGADLDGWPGEKWLDLKSTNVARIMRARIQLAAKMGCDAIDPDNVDAYDNGGGGFGLTTQDTINFVNKVLVAESQPLKLAVGLKNAGAIVPSVLTAVQFSVNEQCAEFDECATYAPFIKAGKPVFHIEYPEGAGDKYPVGTSSVCTRDGGGTDLSRFSTVIKKMNLDGWVEYCSGLVVSTEVN